MVPAPGGRAWFRRVVLLALALAVAYLVVRAVGKIDWAAVLRTR